MKSEQTDKIVIRPEFGRETYSNGIKNIFASLFSGKMGYGSYIGKYSAFHGTVGRFSSISRYVRSNNGMHPSTNPYATTCPMFYSTSKQNGHTFANKQLFIEFKPEPTIGNDCWIGQNVFIAGGVNIGDGTIVYAGAVVTKGIPPYAIAAGVPASVIKYRYDEETIEFLLKLQTSTTICSRSICPSKNHCM